MTGNARALLFIKEWSISCKLKSHVAFRDNSHWTSRYEMVEMH